MEFLRPFLSVEALEAILAIPIDETMWQDQLVWPMVKTGVYFVKSGYHWQRSLLPPPSPRYSSSAASIPGRLWKWAWQLHTPLKLKCFMWKVLHCAIPMMAALFIRKSAPSPFCPLCHSHKESVEHLFLLCPWVKAIWYGGALTYHVNPSDITSWGTWLMAVLQNHVLSKNDLMRVLSLIAFSCWHIWKARCRFLYQHEAINPFRVLSAISTNVAPFLDVRQVSSCRRGGDTSLIVRDKLGVVVRDFLGNFLAARHTKLRVTCVDSVEALAMQNGCDLGISLGFTHVVVESDSHDTISCLRGSISEGMWEAFPILAKCVKLGEAFHVCRWSWIPRLANLAADHLASRRAIQYAIVPMIARGAMLGPDQPVILHMLDIGPAAQALKEVKMELIDAAFLFSKVCFIKAHFACSPWAPKNSGPALLNVGS
ncbi:uncharacterized protein [Pyrus communis]|uniref:uncharacterized protein n=1 Tax=Pyrus communis TaxID=23211 RepID=UPI0035C169E4